MTVGQAPFRKSGVAMGTFIELVGPSQEDTVLLMANLNMRGINVIAATLS